MIRRFVVSVIFIFAVSSCSIPISQPSTAIPHATFGASTATPWPVQNPTATSLYPTLYTPITWASLNLTGRLVYTAVDATSGTYSIQALNLVIGEIHTLVQFPRRSWSDAVVASPNDDTLILTYNPLAEMPYGGQESLYRLSPEVYKPLELLVIPPTIADIYFQPQWSPDGKYIYMVHNNYKTMSTYEIMRMSYPNGKPEKLIHSAYWPRPSLDGEHLVYVVLDLQTGNNQLSLAKADGSDPHPVPVSGLPVPRVIDTPMISPDNQTILFSSPDQPSSFEPNWVDKMLGVQLAFADGTLPSDWWSVPISGGVAKQITRIQALALYGVYSPDQQFIASFSSNSIFVMKPDGTEVTRVVNDIGGIVGTVNWIP